MLIIENEWTTSRHWFINWLSSHEHEPSVILFPHEPHYLVLLNRSFEYAGVSSAKTLCSILDFTGTFYANNKAIPAFRDYMLILSLLVDSQVKENRRGSWDYWPFDSQNFSCYHLGHDFIIFVLRNLIRLKFLILRFTVLALSLKVNP
jgi:hypothetical protein